jgi:hypothetical protein
MSQIISFTSVNISNIGSSYIKSPGLSYDHLILIDKFIRSTFKEKKSVDWSDIKGKINGSIYETVQDAGENLTFSFFRAWDESILGDGESFLVAFDGDAPFELQNKVVLATPYPLLYASVIDLYPCGGGRLLLLNDEHDPIYFDDYVWKDEEQTEKVKLPALTVLQNQFPSVEDYDNAVMRLKASGYKVVIEAFNEV